LQVNEIENVSDVNGNQCDIKPEVEVTRNGILNEGNQPGNHGLMIIERPEKLGNEAGKAETSLRNNFNELD